MSKPNSPKGIPKLIKPLYQNTRGEMSGIKYNTNDKIVKIIGPLYVVCLSIQYDTGNKYRHCGDGIGTSKSKYCAFSNIASRNFTFRSPNVDYFGGILDSTFKLLNIAL